MGKPYPSLQQIRKAIRDNVARTRLQLDDVAGTLHVSRSHLQRTLAAADTSYSLELRAIRISRALECLLVERYSAARTAQEIGLTRDHLRVQLLAATGLSTRQIQRAVRLHDIVTSWQHQTEPRAGTKLYYRRRKQWLAADHELHQLLADLPAAHPMASWAKGVLVAAARPDFRRRSERSTLRKRRAEDNARWRREFNSFLADFTPATSGSPFAAEEGPKQTPNGGTARTSNVDFEAIGT